MSDTVIEIPQYIIHDGKAYQRIKENKDGLFDGYEAIMPALPVRAPWLGYVGPKIPLEEWQKVAAFFKCMYDETKSEVQVRLYLNKEEKIWKAWAFPQKRGTGMTTTELDEKEGDERVKAGIAKGWIEGGTIHSHCNAQAFQSSTDRENEKTKNGVHITIGKIDEGEYDLHGRVVFKGTQYEIGWANWFQLPEGVTGVPWKFRDDVMKWFLQQAVPSDFAFPEEWKENVIKETYQYRGPQGGGHNERGFWGPRGEFQSWGSYSERGNGAHSDRDNDVTGVAHMSQEEIEIVRSRRSKKEKRELRKELQSTLRIAKKANITDKEDAKLNRVAIKVIQLCNSRAIDTDELFILAMRDPRFLDKEDNQVLDEYEKILKNEGVIAADVEHHILELELTGVADETEGFYGG